MRRLILAIAIALAFTVYALPQEPTTGKVESKGEADQGDPWIWWKWVNFLILAGGLGYLISKHAPAYFAQRSHEIQDALLEGARAKQEAEARAAEIEKRLAGLDREMESLRKTATAESAAEAERLRQEAERRLQRIQQQAAQEIELMTIAARQELRKYTALLALDLAEQRIHSRITKDVQEELVDGFLQDLRTRVKPDASARR